MFSVILYQFWSCYLYLWTNFRFSVHWFGLFFCFCHWFIDCNVSDAVLFIFFCHFYHCCIWFLLIGFSFTVQYVVIHFVCHHFLSFKWLQIFFLLLYDIISLESILQKLAYDTDKLWCFWCHCGGLFLLIGFYFPFDSLWWNSFFLLIYLLRYLH